jgi:enamine deaminase RidA (YjgF/YER057c/UK114 family)
MTTIARLNPPTLPSSPAFSQGVLVSGSPRMIYVGGQYGAGTDLREQVRNALRNVEAVVVSAGGTLDEVVTWQVALLQGQDVQQCVAALSEMWADRGKPPALTFLVVAGMAVPDALVEITATAVLPEAYPS